MNYSLQLSTMRQHIYFFLKQQFITWSMRADHSSYFITTYIQTEAIWKKKNKNKWEND